MTLNGLSQFLLPMARARHEQPRDQSQTDNEQRGRANEGNEAATLDHQCWTIQNIQSRRLKVGPIENVK